MYDMSIIRSRGGSEEDLKKAFTAKGADDKLKRVIDRVSARISEGVSYNMRNYKLYYALDLAWNKVPYRMTETAPKSRSV